MKKASFLRSLQIPVCQMLLLAVSGSGTLLVAQSRLDEADTVPPVLSCQNFILKDLDSHGLLSIVPEDILISSSDNSGMVHLVSLSPDTFECFNTSNPDYPTATLTVDDSHGNKASCSATVIPRDVTAPTLICQDATVNLDAFGSVSISHTDIVVLMSDNCAISTASLFPQSFNCSNLGENFVTYQVSDQWGNSSECNVIVTVEDAIVASIIGQKTSVDLHGHSSDAR